MQGDINFRRKDVTKMLLEVVAAYGMSNGKHFLMTCTLYSEQSANMQSRHAKSAVFIVHFSNVFRFIMNCI